MARRNESHSKKCQKYLNEKRRIRNKTKALEEKLNRIKKEESKENIIRCCRIGREKEGFNREEFKFKPKKGVNNEHKN